MKILYLAHRIPYPPNKGEKTRCFHQIQALSARHTLDLFCFADSPEEARGQARLQLFCRRVHTEVIHPAHGYLRSIRGAFAGVPASVAYYASPSFKDAVSSALADQKYDLIFVYCSSMAQFIPDHNQVPTMIDFVDADSAKWHQYSSCSLPPLRWLYRREGNTLERYEKNIAENFNISVVATDREASELGGGISQHIEIIENGVTWPADCDDRQLPAAIKRLQPYAIFVGTMDYRPNADAVIYFSREIWPLLHKKHPEVRFLIVGRNPTRSVCRLAHLPGVVVTGAVDDVYDYVRGAAVAVAPFRICQGVQNKILEALIAGVPVVSTSRPAEAIKGLASQLLLVSDSAIGFADAVVMVLENPEFRRRSIAALAKLREDLAWTPNLERLEGLLMSAISSSSEKRQSSPIRVTA